MKMNTVISGHIVLFDEEDLCLLSLYPWYVNNGVLTARAGKSILLFHRLICPTRDVVDHINGDRLDNRRANLRACTQMENLRNRSIAKHNKSGYKGIYKTVLRNGGSRWRAEIGCNRRKISLGTFETPQKAAEAYDSAAKKYHGEFARTNKALGLV